MTHIATRSAPEPGKFRPALAAVWAFLQALEFSSSGVTSNLGELTCQRRKLFTLKRSGLFSLRCSAVFD